MNLREHDFIRQAEQYQRQTGCSWRQAASAVANAQPALHAQYITFCREGGR